MFFIFDISWDDILTKFKDLKIISNAYRKTISLKWLQKDQDQKLAAFRASEAFKFAKGWERKLQIDNRNANIQRMLEIWLWIQQIL